MRFILTNVKLSQVWLLFVWLTPLCVIGQNGAVLPNNNIVSPVYLDDVQQKVTLFLPSLEQQLINNLEPMMKQLPNAPAVDPNIVKKKIHDFAPKYKSLLTQKYISIYSRSLNYAEYQSAMKFLGSDVGIRYQNAYSKSVLARSMLELNPEDMTKVDQYLQTRIGGKMKTVMPQLVITTSQTAEQWFKEAVMPDVATNNSGSLDNRSQPDDVAEPFSLKDDKDDKISL